MAEVQTELAASTPRDIGDLLRAVKLQKQQEELGLIPPSRPDFELAEGPEGLDRLLDDEPAMEVQGPSGRIYHDVSLFCLRPSDQPRRAAIFFVEWRFFDPIILLTILCNCASMAWEVRHQARNNTPILFGRRRRPRFLACSTPSLSA